MGSGIRWPRPSKAFEWIGWVGLTAVLLGATDTDGRTARRHELAALHADVALALTADEAAFRGFCTSTTPERLIRALYQLRRIMPGDTPRSYEKRQRSIDPYRDRLCDCLRNEFEMTRFVEQHRALRKTPFETLSNMASIISEMDSIHADSNRDVAERLAALDSLLHRARVEAPLMSRARILHEMAEVSLEDSSKGKGWLRRYLRAAVDDAMTNGNFPFACQILGGIAASYAHDGQNDSAVAVYAEAIDLASRYRLGEQMARLHRMLASLYASQGQLSLAHDLYRRAVEICFERGAEPNAAVEQLNRIDFYASLGCWELVRDGLLHVPIYIQDFQDHVDPDASFLNERMHALQARLAIAEGRIADANELYKQLVSPRDDRSPRRAQFAADWSEGLLANRLPEAALRVSDEARRECVENNIPEWETTHILLCARAQAALGDTAGVAGRLADFERAATTRNYAPPREWIWRDALRLQLALQTGSVEEVFAARNQALRRIGALVEGSEFGIERYLLSSSFREVQKVLHHSLLADPRRGYWTELRWRAFVRPSSGHEEAFSRRGSRSGLAADFELSEDQLRAVVQRLQENLRRQDAVHCVFWSDGESVIRWTADGHSVECSVLGITTAELRRQAGRAWKRCATDPRDSTAGLDVATVRDLHALGSVVLPSTVFQSTIGRPRRLFVSAEGTLGIVPFSALSLRAEEYRPLIEIIDVVEYRPQLHESAKVPLRQGAGLAVVDPALSQRMQNAHGPLPRLDAGRQEIEPLLLHAPSTRVLTGPEATKEQLQSTWGNAGFVYFATHVVAVDGPRFAGFIPLAPGATKLYESEELDAEEISASDLRGCRLVVLSGCASGRGYVGSDNESPSLGEACIDAGAAAAIETSWPIRDDTAAQVMRDFIERWQGSHQDPVTALNQTLRAQCAGARGARHPFHWAAYSVVVGSLAGAESQGRRTAPKAVPEPVVGSAASSR